MYLVKVIHIEDSKEVCDLYKDMFTIDNHSIISFKDGREALKHIITNTFDLILLDMKMPNYSGVDFLRDLKIQKPSELKKVVVVSALQFDGELLTELLDFGIHSVEEKPPNLKSLVDMQKNMIFK